MTRALLAAIVLLALPTTALADARFDRASGSGKQSIPQGTEAFLTHISFSARAQDPLTTVADGYFVARGSAMGSPFAQKGEVTCLRVEGNRASIRYRFDKASGGTAAFEGGGIQVFVEDNGPKGDRSTFDPPQTAGAFELDARTCDDPNLRLLAYQPIDSGNFVVRDSSP